MLDINKDSYIKRGSEEHRENIKLITDYLGTQNFLMDNLKWNPDQCMYQMTEEAGDKLWKHFGFMEDSDT